MFAGRLGKRLGLPEDQCAELFYASLLRFIGCSVGIHEERGSALGDVEGFQRGLAMSDLLNVEDVFARLDENMATEAPSEDRKAAFVAIGEASGDPEMLNSLTRPHCELGAKLATDVGMPPVVVEAMSQVYERWDGAGAPVGVVGDNICLPARVMHITGAFKLLRRSIGAKAAFGLIIGRKGGHLDPELCDAISTDRDELLEGFESATLLDAFLDESPGDWRVAADKLVDAAKACAHNVDHRSIYTLGHSAGVAELAAKAGACADLDEGTCEELLIAGYLHDLGRVGVPTAIWDKPGELTRSEWAKVEQHTFLTDRILKTSPALDQYAKLASSHHERADGSGYHRQVENLDLQCAIVAAADCYHAMLEDRPHRPALVPEKATEELLALAESGPAQPDGDQSRAGCGERPESQQQEPAGGSHEAGGRGHLPDGPRPVQQGDRGQAVHLREDGGAPRRPYLRQDRHAHPARGGLVCGRPRPLHQVGGIGELPYFYRYRGAPRCGRSGLLLAWAHHENKPKA